MMNGKQNQTSLLLLLAQCMLVESSQHSAMMKEMPTLVMAGEESLAGGYALNGELYIASEDDSTVWVVSFNALARKAMLKRFELSNNGTGASLLQADATSVGSGDQLISSKTSRELVYDVLHHHAYIAVGTRIIIAHLNTSTGPLLTHQTLEVAQTPISLRALTFNGDTYLLVAYKTPDDRGYIKRFRKYQSGWGDYGGLVLVTTPSWFDVNRVSNNLLYKGYDSLNNYDTLWVGVAERWTIYTTNLIDGTQESYAAPQPCDSIERLVYSEHRQRMLVQCREATVLFDAKQKGYYAIWPEAIGEAHISGSGKYGAVVNQSHSITFLNLHQDYQSTTVSVRGEISNVTFVDASSTQHYFCYVVQRNETYSVNCVNIELLFQNASSEVYTSELFDSSLTPASDSVYSPCPSLYSRHKLLTIQHTMCIEENCVPLLQLFDMTTLINTYNVTGVNALFLAFKAVPFDPPTLTPLTTEAPTIQEPTTEKHTPSSPSLPTTVRPVPGVSTTSAQSPGELYLQCTGELEKLKESNEQLLWISIVLGSLFSLALLVTTLVLTVLLCVACKSGRNKTTVTLERYSSGDKPPAYSDHEYPAT